MLSRLALARVPRARARLEEPRPAVIRAGVVARGFVRRFATRGGVLEARDERLGRAVAPQRLRRRRRRGRARPHLHAAGGSRVPDLAIGVGAARAFGGGADGAARRAPRREVLERGDADVDGVLEDEGFRIAARGVLAPVLARRRPAVPSAPVALGARRSVPREHGFRVGLARDAARPRVARRAVRVVPRDESRRVPRLPARAPRRRAPPRAAAPRLGVERAVDVQLRLARIAVVRERDVGERTARHGARRAEVHAALGDLEPVPHPARVERAGDAKAFVRGGVDGKRVEPPPRVGFADAKPRAVGIIRLQNVPRRARDAVRVLGGHVVEPARRARGVAVAVGDPHPPVRRVSVVWALVALPGSVAVAFDGDSLLQETSPRERAPAGRGVLAGVVIGGRDHEHARGGVLVRVVVREPRLEPHGEPLRAAQPEVARAGEFSLPREERRAVGVLRRRERAPPRQLRRRGRLQVHREGSRKRRLDERLAGVVKAARDARLALGGAEATPFALVRGRVRRDADAPLGRRRRPRGDGVLVLPVRLDAREALPREPVPGSLGLLPSAAVRPPARRVALQRGVVRRVHLEVDVDSVPALEPVVEDVMVRLERAVPRVDAAVVRPLAVESVDADDAVVALPERLVEPPVADGVRDVDPPARGLVLGARRVAHDALAPPLHRRPRAVRPGLALAHLARHERALALELAPDVPGVRRPPLDARDVAGARDVVDADGFGERVEERTPRVGRVIRARVRRRGDVVLERPAARAARRLVPAARARRVAVDRAQARARPDAVDVEAHELRHRARR